jgi:uncharacterized protein (DUF1015 family)
MAEVLPLNALHYNLAAVGSLEDVVAPPYDVIDPVQRRELVARSPFNVVELDLPEPLTGGDPYEHAAETLEEWTLQGILTQDREPSIWALTQDYVGPDGTARTRRALLARVRVVDYGPGGVRPHERTQPGPKEDRLRLTRATRHNLSPIFSLHPGDAWRHVEPALESHPWGEAKDADGTTHRAWRISDPAIHDAVTAELADAELLIADGHHRYETARTYAEDIGGDGGHRYTLMSLVSLDDPGLTVFATHRVLKDLDTERMSALQAKLDELFEADDISEEELDPDGAEGIGVFGFASRDGARRRLRLRDPGILAAAFPDSSDSYRTLDAAILERLVFADGLGMTAEDVEAKKGLDYVKSTADALQALREGAGAAFLLRPTPIEQVRAVAQAGETMPPKSTYFFPKFLTGIAFNPLS